jgi:hypothetical protein
MRKFHFWPALIAASTLALAAQMTSAPKQKQKPTPAVPATQTAAQAAATEPAVATITGSCPTPGQTGCKHALTQAQFERVISAINPELPAGQRRELASAYVQVYVLANEARKLGLDKDPILAERLRLDEMKALASAYSDSVRKQLKPTDADIDTFYAENRDRFEELQLKAVIVPKTIAKELKAEETKALAEKLQARAAAGEDTAKLQTEATLAVRSEGAAPNTDLGWRGRGRLGPFEKAIIGLRAGQVSNVLDDAQNWYIFKVAAKRLVPLANVKSDIENAIAGQRFNHRLEQLLQGVRADLDPKYFGAPPAEPPPPNQSPASPKR